MARNPVLGGSVFGVVVKELVWSSLEVGLVGNAAGVVVVMVELGRVFVDEVCTISFRVAKTRLRRFLVCFRRCSSRICIFSSLRALRVVVPSRFRSFVRVVPKTLKSLSHEAELAQIERTRRARSMNGGGSRPGKQKSA